ncbi:tagaturonate reductase [Persicobacter diffluens]|uniref:Altronate oxidoreductase n=1 Tax=Persicobacter diffluens TaxID=981 RepID=A0AAN4W433_9BACT|nr:altronate oxidoreductase [Persicobacter diffluens]
MKLNRKTCPQAQSRPIKIVQFGEGNFLRAFVDWAIQQLNQKTDFNGNIAVVQPLQHGMVDHLAAQDGLYHTVLQGIQKGALVRNTELIDVISAFNNPYTDFEGFLSLGELEELQFIFSNTTEAGISFNEQDTMEMQGAVSFPAKLTRLLFHRFQVFQGDMEKGLFVVPCELINHNGTTLKSYVRKYAELWDLGEEFIQWLEQANTFCNTLVDRIVPGFPKNTISTLQEELGYQDQLVVEGEIFMLWVIEGGGALQAALPLDAIGLNVVYTDDQQPYRNRKVHILNGAHTTMVPLGLISGLQTVQEAVEDKVLGKYLSLTIHQEIIPTLSLPPEALEQFANEVLERFRNPYIKHYLSSIALNAFPKYKTRVLPCVLQYFKCKGELPERLILALSSYIFLYANQLIALQDDPDIIALVQKAWEMDDRSKTAQAVLAYEALWEQDLNQIPGITKLVARQLEDLQQVGIAHVLQQYNLLAHA